MACLLKFLGFGRSSAIAYELPPEIEPIPKNRVERMNFFNRIYQSILPQIRFHFQNMEQCFSKKKPEDKSRAYFFSVDFVSRPSGLDNRKLLKSLQDVDTIGKKILLKLYKPEKYKIVSSIDYSAINFLGLNHIGLTNLLGVFVFDRILNQVCIRFNKEEISAEDIVLGEILEHGGDVDFSDFVNDDDSKMSFDDLERLSRQIAETLSYTSKREVIHRDIKPSNLLVYNFLNKEASSHLKLTDLEFATTFKDAIDSSHLAGTKSYMAPELLFSCSKHTEKADVWSFGATLIELATGRKITESVGYDSKSHWPYVKQNFAAQYRDGRFCFVKSSTDGYSIDDITVDSLVKMDGTDEQKIKFLEFVKPLLNPDPKERPSFEEILAFLSKKSAIDEEAV
jgi:serine/threonine protein kinase